MEEEMPGGCTTFERGAPPTDPADAYCSSVKAIFWALKKMKPGLRIAALTAVQELLAEEP